MYTRVLSALWHAVVVLCLDIRLQQLWFSRRCRRLSRSDGFLSLCMAAAGALAFVSAWMVHVSKQVCRRHMIGALRCNVSMRIKQLTFTLLRSVKM